jgi:hypothetical protein
VEFHANPFQPDEHAPERPPSAYVIFSNREQRFPRPSAAFANVASEVRETLRGQELSFTEIAKIVGERWQVLPADSRDACERQANSAKEKYYAELAEYKKRPEYESYQKYLEEFKAKHAAPPKGESFHPLRSIVTSGNRGRRQTSQTGGRHHRVYPDQQPRSDRTRNGQENQLSSVGSQCWPKSDRDESPHGTFPITLWACAFV